MNSLLSSGEGLIPNEGPVLPKGKTYAYGAARVNGAVPKKQDSKTDIAGCTPTWGGMWWEEEAGDR